MDGAIFHAQTEEEKHEYNLPKKLLKYADHYLKKFIPDKELKDSILTENPVPKNFMKVPSLDVFIRDTMKEERRNHELTMDSVLEKVQGKTRDIFSPLSRVWTYLQEVTSSDHEDEDESIQVDLDLLLTHIQKTVLILAQALNTMTYHRRFNAFSVIMAQAEAKSILKEKADILGEKDFLLGKDFRNQVVKDTEAKTKMHNGVQRKKKYAKAQPQALITLQMPFQESPSRQQGYRGNGGGRRTTNKLVYRKKRRQIQSQGKGQCDNKPFSQQFGISCANTRFRFTKRTPIHKKSIPGNKNTSGPSSRKTKILSKVLGKINQRPKHAGHYTRVPDTLQKKTLPKIKRPVGNQSKDQKILVNQEISDILKKCRPHPNQFVSTLFLLGKKDGAIIL